MSAVWSNSPHPFSLMVLRKSWAIPGPGGLKEKRGGAVWGFRPDPTHQEVDGFYCPGSGSHLSTSKVAPWLYAHILPKWFHAKSVKALWFFLFSDHCSFYFVFGKIPKAILVLSQAYSSISPLSSSCVVAARSHLRVLSSLYFP